MRDGDPADAAPRERPPEQALPRRHVGVATRTLPERRRTVARAMTTDPLSLPAAGRPHVDRATVLGKIVLVLFAFRADDAGTTQAEIARRTGLSKSTLHRMLCDLVEVRMLERHDGLYRLSGQVFQLGMRASEGTLVEVASPFMEDLYEQTRETVHLGVLDGDSVVYVAKRGGRRQSLPTRLGGRMPLHCTALGKALLAFAPDDVVRKVLAAPLARRTAYTVIAPGLLRQQLHDVRQRGVAFEREESTLGITCAAAPVVLPLGERLAAVSLTGPTSRFRAETAAAALKQAAAGISAVLTERIALQSSA